MAVHVPGDQEVHEPVADGRLLDQVEGVVLVGFVGLPGDEVPPEAGHAHDGHDVDGVERGEDGEHHEPEPERDVDLLVDDVKAKDAEGVQLHDGARGSVLVEGALGHAGEDLHHGVRPVLVVHVDEVEHVRAVGHEHAAQEEIDEIHLTDDVHEVQHVAEEIPEEGKL